MGIYCVSQGTQTEALYQSSGGEWEGDGREVQEGGDKCTPITESPQQKAMSLKMISPGL